MDGTSVMILLQELMVLLSGGEPSEEPATTNLMPACAELMPRSRMKWIMVNWALKFKDWYCAGICPHRSIPVKPEAMGRAPSMERRVKNIRRSLSRSETS